MDAYQSFADLIDYPNAELLPRVDECTAALATDLPRAAERLRDFQRSCAQVGTAGLQEIYTSTFDMQPECTLNLGYHLFGEDQRRGMFLAKLKELYGQAGVDTGSELPDHLCLLLRYLSNRRGAEESTEIISECLLPSVSKIARGVDSTSNPYRAVLDALSLWLEKEGGCEEISSAGKREREAGQG